jgi:preprotein translocase subunit SecG
MQQIVLAIHLMAAFLLIALILMQQGKGSDIGASFGSGASQTVFGSQGSTSFLVKIIAGLIAVFFITSLALNHLIADSIKQQQLANTPQVLLQHQNNMKK